MEQAKPATGAAAVQTVEILLSPLRGSMISGARCRGLASLTRRYMSSAPAGGTRSPHGLVVPNEEFPALRGALTMRAREWPERHSRA